MNILKIDNPIKILTLNFFLSIVFFLSMFFLTKDNNTSLEGYISIGVVLIGFLSFVNLHLFNNYKMILNITKGQEESTKDVLFYYFPRMLTMFLLFLFSYNYFIPLIGDLTNNLFSIYIFETDINILTTFLTILVGFWFFVGNLLILLLDLSILESLKETFSYIINNLIKSILLLLSIIFLMFLFQLTLVSTYDLNILIAMPIKVISFALFWSWGNNMIIKTYISSIEED